MRIPPGHGVLTSQRVCVVRLEREAARLIPSEHQLERVVRLFAQRLDVGDVRDQRELREERPTGVHRSRGDRGLVDVDVRGDAINPRPDVADRRDVQAHLLLRDDVELLRTQHLVIHRLRAERPGWFCRVAERVRGWDVFEEKIWQCAAGRRVARVGPEVLHERRVLHHGSRAVLDRVVGNPEAPAKHNLARCGRRESEPRSPVGPVGLDADRGIRVRRRLYRPDAVRPLTERRDPVLRLGDRRVGFPAQAQVQRQPAARVPVVVHVQLRLLVTVQRVNREVRS